MQRATDQKREPQNASFRAAIELAERSGEYVTVVAGAAGLAFAIGLDPVLVAPLMVLAAGLIIVTHQVQRAASRYEWLDDDAAPEPQLAPPQTPGAGVGVGASADMLKVRQAELERRIAALSATRARIAATLHERQLEVDREIAKLSAERDRLAAQSAAVRRFVESDRERHPRAGGAAAAGPKPQREAESDAAAGGDRWVDSEQDPDSTEEW